jgi:hypothetical protein
MAMTPGALLRDHRGDRMTDIAAMFDRTVDAGKSCRLQSPGRHLIFNE